MRIDFQKIRGIHISKARDNHGQSLLTDFEAKRCFMTFKLMVPETEAKDFSELMDFLHFKEQEKYKQEVEEFIRFCSQ